MMRAFGDLRVAIIGTPERILRARLYRELERRGAIPSRRISRDTRLAIVAHGAVGLLAADRLERKVARASAVAEIMTEHQILRELGLLDSPPRTNRSYDREQLIRLSGLAPKDHLWLEMFDLLEPEDGRYGFADLALARKAKALIESGISVAEIISAAIVLRRRTALQAIGHIGSLVRPSTGEVALKIGDTIAEICGQLRLPLIGAAASSPCELYEAANRADARGEWAAAERLYRQCAQIDPSDAIALFNWGHALLQQGRTAEAAVLFQKATDLDPLLSDAWYNLAHIAEDRGRWSMAIRHLEMAIACDEHYVDAIFNLAMLHLRRDELARAAALFERYLAQDPSSRWAEAARAAAKMCRAGLLARRQREHPE